MRPLRSTLLPGLLGVAASQPQVTVPTVQVAPGIHMPVLSIGTGGLERAQTAAIVGNWLSLGGRGIDTAQIYKDQDVVSKAIKDAGVDRQQLFITSKIMGCSGVKANVEYDLEQLGTHYIDLLLIHFPTPTWSGCNDAWAVLEDFRSKGVLRAIGVSNFKKINLERLVTTAKVLPAINQIEHNVLRHDDETIAFARSLNITIEAYSPLGQSNHSGDIIGNAVIHEVAESHNVSSVQVALRWIVQHGHVATFQSTSKEHQLQDADLFKFNLTSEEMARLDGLQRPLAAMELSI